MEKRVPPSVHLAVERDRNTLEAEGKWVRVEWGLQMLRLTRPTYAKLEYGENHGNGVREKSHVRRYYYADGTYYTSIGL